MEGLKSVATTGGIVLSAAVSVAALGADIFGLFPNIAWQWFALVGFIAFALLVGRRIHELRSELDEIKDNQALELAIRRLQETGRHLKPSDKVVDGETLVKSLENVDAWIAESERVLSGKDYIEHFRGSDGDGLVWIAESVEINPVENAGSNDVSIGTKAINDFIDLRIQRLGEILFSLPGPAGKAMRLG